MDNITALKFDLIELSQRSLAAPSSAFVEVMKKHKYSSTVIAS